MFHFRSEIPGPMIRELDACKPQLTDEEIRIIKAQIQKNSKRVESDLKRLELFLNKERYPSNAPFIDRIRRNMSLSMDENDTFRKVLWHHYQSLEISRREIEGAA